MNLNEQFKKDLQKKLKGLTPDYEKIRLHVKDQLDLLCKGLPHARVPKEAALGCVLRKVEEYLELPITPGVPVSTWGLMLAKRNVNNFTNRICEAVPLAKRSETEQAVRSGMKDWAVMIYEENNLPSQVDASQEIKQK